MAVRNWRTVSVGGWAMAVTAVALMYQWAEMHTMAVGRGWASPKVCHASV